MVCQNELLFRVLNRLTTFPRPLSATGSGRENAPHCGDRLFRARKPPTKFPPLAVVGGFPPPLPLSLLLIRKPKLLTQHKKADHRKGDPFFVEHRRFELLTPTLPVLCATNCANAPNSGYINICFVVCKALFSPGNGSMGGPERGNVNLPVAFSGGCGCGQNRSSVLSYG